MSDENKKMQMLNELRDLASELKRAPTMNEYIKAYGHTRHFISIMFGGFSPLLQSLGLTPHKAKKIDDSIFEVKDIESHLNKYNQESDIIDPVKVSSNNWCVVSDVHYPFHHEKKLEEFFQRAEKKKYDLWILNGDVRDMYSHAKFPRSHNIFTPREENTLGRKLTEEFWARAKKINPKARLFLTMGNHSVRPMKRIMEEYPEAEDWIAEAMKREFSFDGVTTLFNSRDFILLNEEIAVFHGYKMKLGDHRDQHLMSCITGHTHRPGIVYRRMFNKIIFEANSGFMGNPAAKGLTYTSSKLTEWVNGFLEGDEFGPRFIAL